MHRDRMKNGCKSAVFFHRDALFFASRRKIISVATYQFFCRDALIAPREASFKPPAGHHLSLLSVLIEDAYRDKKMRLEGRKNRWGLTGLTVNTPKMHTSIHTLI